MDGRDAFDKTLRFVLDDIGLTFSLKQEQEHILKSIVLDRNDVLAILPTCYGKSLSHRVQHRRTRRLFLELTVLLGQCLEVELEMFASFFIPCRSMGT